MWRSLVELGVAITFRFEMKKRETLFGGNHMSVLNGLLFFAVVFGLAVTPAGCGIFDPEDKDKTARLNFTVKVESGFLANEEYYGSFSFVRPSTLNEFGNDSLRVDTLTFEYRGTVYTGSTVDYPPFVLYERGVFKGLYMVGGINTERFGLNDGFPGFYSPTEYFGYLDEATFVAGFGIIEYEEQ